MSIACEELLKIKYGTRFTELGLEVSRVFGNYRKVGSNEYVKAYPVEADGEVVFCGFAWVASDGVAEWIFTRKWVADDGANVAPPCCLLPEPGLFSYQSLVEYGRRADPKHFSDYVSCQRQVSFGDFAYYYRKCSPLETHYPIGIEADLWPLRHVRFR
jgi:hypothetical protein